MERMRHHVTASGNTTLRGFYASENVNFDPPNPSMRINVQKAKCNFVVGLANGATSRAEEERIRDAVGRSQNSYEVIRMVSALGGWDGMDDELEPGDLDEIAKNIAQVLDQRDYPVYRFIRRHLPVLHYDDDKQGPSLGDAVKRLLTMPSRSMKNEINLLLSQTDEMMLRIGLAGLRARSHMVRAAGVSIETIEAVTTQAPPVHRRDELVTFLYRAVYTVRIATALELRQYGDLYKVLIDMADGSKDLRLRRAARDGLETMAKAFLAVERAVQTYGSNEARTTVGRFMVARRRALDAFQPAAPANQVLNAVADAIGSAANTIVDLETAIVNLPDVLTTVLTLAGFLKEDGDDKARDLVNVLFGLNALGHLPTRVKLDAINACLDGNTDDDDEQAILKILQAAKDLEPAELWQVASSATWEALDFSIDFTENDELVALLAQPV